MTSEPDLPEKPDHLRLRIPEKGEVTLSMPDGVIRALRDQRLPSSAEVWYPEKEAWVSLASYPAVLELLQTLSAHTTVVESPPPPRGRKTSSSPQPSAALPYIELEPEHSVVDPSTSSAPAPLNPPADEPRPPVESAEGSTGSPDTSSGKGTAPPRPPPRERDSIAVPRKSSTASSPSRSKASRAPLDSPPPVVAGESDDTDAGRGRWVTGIVIFLAVAVASTVGWYVHERRKPPRTAVHDSTSAPSASPTPVVNAHVDASHTGSEVLTELPTPLASAVNATPNSLPTLSLQGVPGAGPEPDLLVRLQLADALAWQASKDFSQEGILLASRKVEAVRNSIDAYRVDMRRLPDSVSSSPEMTRKIEPFDEASRVNEVLDAMKEVILFVDSTQGHYRVWGERLAFERASDAAHYNALRAQADSLLQAPVPMDPAPNLRPPRRIVTHLVATLPVGVVDPDRAGLPARHPLNP